MTNQSSILSQIKCIRRHIVDFLVYQLQHDQITEKRVSQVAQAVLDQLTDNLNHDQIYQVFGKIKQDFPELAQEFDAALAACESIEARKIIDKQVLQDISQGNLDQALASLNQFKLK